MKTLKAIAASALLASTLPAFAEIEAPPPGLEGSALIETSATVEAVNPSTRYVALGGPEGNEITVRASERIGNLDKVEPGDQVDIAYYHSVAVDVVAGPEDESAPELQRSASATPGAEPGSGSLQRTATVKILVVDPYKKAIAFRDPEGRWREVSVASPSLEHFLNDLEEGDTVRVTFTDALAVSLIPH